MTRSEDGPGSGTRRRFAVGVVTAVVLAVLAAVAVPLLATSTPSFFSRYHLLERRYVNLEGSAHEGIGCRTCHETAPVANGMALVADFYRSLVTTDPLPTYFTFGPPRREACLTCHANDWSDDASRTARIPHPAHARVASEKRDCVTCHKWIAHLETVMIKHKTMPFSGVCVSYGCHVGTKATAQCFDCHHVLHEDGKKWDVTHRTVAKATGENACLEKCHQVAQCQLCHTTGERPKFTGLPIEVSTKAIEELHVQKDWTAKYHGPEAIKDEARCMLCHVSEAQCADCHLERPRFHGSPSTWIGRHKKATKRVDDPRCIACHDKAWCEDCHRQFKEMG
ncbi:MAG: hypothetical protein Q7W16_04905 [Coriobacteriia bacterium]|nr:hypothetical protein [Coriobacteriia bacterium]